MIQNQMLSINGLDESIVSALMKYSQTKELVQKFEAQFKSRQEIYKKLLKIIQASAILENFEKIAGKAMLIFRKLFKIILKENFSKIRLQDSSLKGISFVNCNFCGSKMENVKLVSCWFIRCQMHEVNWKNMISIEQAVINVQNKETQSFAISPDETILAYGNDNKTVRLCELKNFENIQILHTQNKVEEIEFVSNNFLLLKIQGVIQIWDIGLKKSFRQYKNFQNSKPCLHGLMMHSIKWQKQQNIQLFSIKTGKILRRHVFCIDSFSNEIFFHSQHLQMFYAFANKIIFYDFRRGKKQLLMILNVRYVSGCSITPECDIIVVNIKNFQYQYEIQIWDIRDKKMLQKIENASYFGEVQFQKNSTIMVYFNNQSIHFYDISAGQDLLILSGIFDISSKFLFVPQTSFLLYGQPKKRRITLIDTTIKQKIKKPFYQSSVYNSQQFFSEDGKQLLGIHEKNKIKMIDFDSGKNYEKKNIVGAIQISCSKDLQTLAFYKKDKKIVYLYDMKKQKVFNQLVNNFKVNFVAISPDNQTLACGNEDFTIRFFKLKTFKQIQIYKGHSKAVKFLLFSPDNKRLASHSFDNTIIIWDLDKHQIIATYQQQDDTLVMAFSLGSNSFAQGQKSQIILWNTNVQGELFRIQCTQDVKYIMFLNESLILGNTLSDVKIWDAKSGDQLFEFKLHGFVAFCPKNKILVIAGNNFYVFNFQYEGQIQRLITHESSVVQIKICSENKILVSFLNDYSLNIWDLDSQILKKKIQEEQAIINCFTLSRSGNSLAYGCKDLTIHLFDIKSLENMNKIRGHQSQINDIFFSHDEQLLVSGSQDGMILIWNLNQCRSKVIIKKSSPINQVMFCNHNQIISYHLDNIIRFWNIENKQHELGFYKHYNEITSVAVSIENQNIAVGSNDGKIQLLSIENSKVVSEFAFHDSKVFQVVFSDDGKYLASTSDDESICVIELKFSSLIHRIFRYQTKLLTVVVLNGKEALIVGNHEGAIFKITFDKQKILPIRIYDQASQYLHGSECNFYESKITSTYGKDLVNILQDNLEG